MNRAASVLSVHRSSSASLVRMATAVIRAIRPDIISLRKDFVYWIATGSLAQADVRLAQKRNALNVQRRSAVVDC